MLHRLCSATPPGMKSTSERSVHVHGKKHEHEIRQMRILMYDLTKSFFAEAPDDKICQRWHMLFSAMAQARQVPEIASASEKIVETLDKLGCEGVRQEYNTLFIDPYSGSHLNRTASWYADGKSLGPALAGVRQLMQDAGVERVHEYREPEDSMEVLLDTMILLLDDAARKGEEHGLEFRQRLFLDFIMPLAEAMIQRMEKMDDFPFYRACAGYLKGWLLLEQPFAR